MFVKIDENNVVIQRQPYQEQGYIEVNDYVICGMVLQEDGSFKIPSKTLTELKQEKIIEISQNNPANNHVTIDVDLANGTQTTLTFNGGDASAAAIKGGIELAQNLAETTVKVWDIKNKIYEFTFEEALVISATIGATWRNYMYERNNKLEAIENAATLEELELIKWN